MRFARACAAAVAAALVAGPASMAMASQAQGAKARDAGGSGGIHLPYTDPNQAGWLTLCGVDLKPVTHGLVTTKPFVWRVVSDVPAPAGYFVRGAKAQMFAYQPRPYTPAGAWSGSVMAAPSYYDNRKHPMAQFTPIDEPLSYMTIAYPPIWDHLIELRLYLGAPNVPEDTRGYAAADVQVKGNTWTLVAGGSASCTSGRVVSEEVVVGMPGARGTPKPSPSGSASPTSSAPVSGGAPSSAPTGPPGAVPAADSHSSGTGAAAAAFGIVALVAAAAVSGSLLWRRRRRATG
jgi:hypothetical protein